MVKKIRYFITLIPLIFLFLPFVSYAASADQQIVDVPIELEDYLSLTYGKCLNNNAAFNMDNINYAFEQLANNYGVDLSGMDKLVTYDTFSIFVFVADDFYITSIDGFNRSDMTMDFNTEQWCFWGASGTVYGWQYLPRTGQSNSVPFNSQSYICRTAWNSYWNEGVNYASFPLQATNFKSGGTDIPFIVVTEAPLLSDVLTMGDLDFLGHSDGFSIDLFDSIAEGTYSVFGNQYHTLYSLSDILNASDVFTSMRMLLENIYNTLMNLGVLLSKILIALMWFFDDLINFIKNFWTNLQLILTKVINLIVGTFTVETDDSYFSTWLDKWSSSVLFPFLESLGMLDEFENLPFVKLFNDIAAASLGSNGEYQIKNLIVPEDLSVFAIAFQNKLNEEAAPILGVLNSYNIMFVELINNVSSGVVPSFTFPSFTLGGHTYSGFSFDLSPLLPYMPTIRLMLSAWMWISFAIYFIRTLPTIIRGSGTFDSGDSNSSDNMVTLGRMTFDENEILSN